MNLREALEILGPDRVRKGMRAIDDRRHEVGIGCSCFIGEAFGGANGAHLVGVYNDDRRVAVASATCEAWFEGWACDGRYPEQGHPMRYGSIESRAELRAECVAFLAEHGSAVEPAPASTGVALS